MNMIHLFDDLCSFVELMLSDVIVLCSYHIGISTGMQFKSKTRLASSTLLPYEDLNVLLRTDSWAADVDACSARRPVAYAGGHRGHVPPQDEKKKNW
jgi:hypothetical protein